MVLVLGWREPVAFLWEKIWIRTAEGVDYLGYLGVDKEGGLILKWVQRGEVRSTGSEYG
jgi:hypothetical protein